MTERLVRPREACRRLGISFITLKRWIYSGKIKAVKTPSGRWWNLLLKVLRGDGSNAPSPVGLNLVDVRGVPFPLNATHDPIGISKSLWARWKSLPQTQKAILLNKMTR